MTLIAAILMRPTTKGSIRCGEVVRLAQGTALGDGIDPPMSLCP